MKIDASLVGTYPSRAQFYRWMSGEIVGLPYSDHCRVLEGLFPGYSAEELFGAPVVEGDAGTAGGAVDLRSCIEGAFEKREVTIDFAGFSGETLYGVIREPIAKIRAGRLAPEEINIRVLVPDLSLPNGLPALAATKRDAPAVRARSEHITRSACRAILAAVNELADVGLVRSVSARVRVYRAVPQFKLYILNRREAFFGFYHVLAHTVSVDGKAIEILDTLGVDTILFRHEANGRPPFHGIEYVNQAQMWFDSVWGTIARDFTP